MQCRFRNISIKLRRFITLGQLFVGIWVLCVTPKEFINISTISSGNGNLKLSMNLRISYWIISTKIGVLEKCLIALFNCGVEIMEK